MGYLGLAHVFVSVGGWVAGWLAGWLAGSGLWFERVRVMRLGLKIKLVLNLGWD